MKTKSATTSTTTTTTTDENAIAAIALPRAETTARSWSQSHRIGLSSQQTSAAHPYTPGANIRETPVDPQPLMHNPPGRVPAYSRTPPWVLVTRGARKHSAHR